MVKNSGEYERREKGIQFLYGSNVMEHPSNSFGLYDGLMTKTASMLSHEIRNALSNIGAYVQLLQLEKILDTPKAEKIHMEIARINKLLNDFRNLAPPHRKALVWQPLAQLIEYAAQVSSPKANMNNIKIQVIIEDKDVYVRANKDELQQAFMNIIENAIQAMNDGGRITIRLWTDKVTKHAFIEFIDTGTGIPRDKIPHIFKFFYTTKKSGSGLGLPICESIIRQHGGTIDVMSKEGEGTVFTLKLPYSS